MKRQWSLALVLAVGIAFLMSRPRRGASLAFPVSGPAPAWEMQDLQGRRVSASNFLGRVVVLNFWATWCPPCRAEIPDFIEFTRHHDTNRVIILGASVDEGGAATVAPFAKALEINYPMLLADERTLDQFGGLAGYPTTFIIRTNGEFATRHLGALSKSDFDKFVLPLVPPQVPSQVPSLVPPTSQ